MYAPLNLHVSHAGETSGTGSWHHPLGRRRRRYDQPTAIRRHQIHGTGEPHCCLHFIRLFHVRDPIQGAGRISGISRARDFRTDTAWSEWRGRASAACSRQLAVAACAFAQHTGHSCTRASSDRSTVPITQKHPVALVKNTHVIWSDVTRTVSLPLPAVAWLGPLSCPCGALAPRSKMWRTLHLRGSRCGPPGSQMHTLAQKYYGKTVSTQSKTRAIVHIGLLFLFRALLSSLLPWGFWAR